MHTGQQNHPENAKTYKHDAASSQWFYRIAEGIFMKKDTGLMGKNAWIECMDGLFRPFGNNKKYTEGEKGTIINKDKYNITAVYSSLNTQSNGIPA